MRAIKLGHHRDVLTRVDAAKVEATCSPSPTFVFNTPAEREQLALRLLTRAHAANKEGDAAQAAALFYEAAQLEPRRTSTLLSHLSMRLKLGEAELVVACYLYLLENRELAPREWEHVRSKLREANQRVVETDDTRRAAVAIQRIARGRLAQQQLVVRRQRSAAARLLTSHWLRRARRLGVGAAALVTQVVLLRLPLPSVPESEAPPPSAAPSAAADDAEVVVLRPARQAPTILASFNAIDAAAESAGACC